MRTASPANGSDNFSNLTPSKKSAGSPSLPDSDEETIRIRLAEEEEYTDTDDKELKREAEAEANRILGLPQMFEITKQDDEIDK